MPSGRAGCPWSWAACIRASCRRRPFNIATRGAAAIRPRRLEDLERGQRGGIYGPERLHPMEGLNPPRYDLLKRHRYVNSTFVQTSRGCHQGCTFCAEPLMNGLKFRYRPVDEV